MKNLILLTLSLCLFSIISCKILEEDMEIPDTVISACDLSPNAGPCEALIPKYYFDQRTKLCTKFDWGGCEGVVPFDTLEECETAECNR